jgi:hypothetical protein
LCVEHVAVPDSWHRFPDCWRADRFGTQQSTHFTQQLICRHGFDQKQFAARMRGAGTVAVPRAWVNTMMGLSRVRSSPRKR